jgi:hypothetical protein
VRRRPNLELGTAEQVDSVALQLQRGSGELGHGGGRATWVGKILVCFSILLGAPLPVCSEVAPPLHRAPATRRGASATSRLLETDTFFLLYTNCAHMANMVLPLEIATSCWT